MSGDQSVTRGIVSGIHATASLSGNSAGATSQLTDVIQTDAGLDNSMSGGPLMMGSGQVIGVTLTDGTHQPPLAIAVPSSDVQAEVEQIQQTGQLVVASLGAEAEDVSTAEAALHGGSAGARITQLTAGGPAERAGLKVGDVIVQLDDQHLDDAHPLVQVMRSRFRPDQKVTVTYARGGSTSQLQMTLRGEHPPCP
jgi:S1-C subfamily serine protease